MTAVHVEDGLLYLSHCLLFKSLLAAIISRAQHDKLQCYLVWCNCACRSREMDFPKIIFIGGHRQWKLIWLKIFFPDLPEIQVGVWSRTAFMVYVVLCRSVKSSWLNNVTILVYNFVPSVDFVFWYPCRIHIIKIPV